MVGLQSVGVNGENRLQREMEATSAVTNRAPKLRYSSGSDTRRLTPATKFTGYTKLAVHIPDCFSSTRAKGSFSIRALDPQRQTQNDDDDDGFLSPQDLSYLGKLLAGSIVGGAVVKYGSIVFPEIVRPNIMLALVMIFTPVIVAVLLLIKQSRAAEG